MTKKICKRCIMSTEGDPNITFDAEGYCNYCTGALKRMEKGYFPNERGEQKLREMIKRIKENSKSSKYDCIMGISGGLDSSYLLYLGSTWGLRILCVHINDGFDTEISKSNIKKLISKSGFDYIEIVPDAEQYANINKAYMKAGVPNIAVPQDNILFTELHSLMKKYRIHYFLSGSNYSLESILQSGNAHTAYDLVQIHDIFNKFGSGKIDKLNFMSTADMQKDQHILHYETLTPLNYVDYTRDKAFQELFDFCGFQYYGSKHLENIFTAFVQLYWLPLKFKVDKRSSHFSSMIISNQMTRDQALEEMQKPLYDEKIMSEYIDVVKKKTNLTDDEFEEIMSSPGHAHNEYQEEKDFLSYKIRKSLWSLIKKLKNS